MWGKIKVFEHDKVTLANNDGSAVKSMRYGFHPVLSTSEHESCRDYVFGIFFGNSPLRSVNSSFPEAIKPITYALVSRSTSVWPYSQVDKTQMRP